MVVVDRVPGTMLCTTRTLVEKHSSSIIVIPDLPWCIRCIVTLLGALLPVRDDGSVNLGMTPVRWVMFDMSSYCIYCTTLGSTTSTRTTVVVLLILSRTPQVFLVLYVL